jgi:hypothetical protein
VSWTDVAFYFMPGAEHHYKSGVGCTGTPFIECIFIPVRMLLGNFRVQNNDPMFHLSMRLEGKFRENIAMKLFRNEFISNIFVLN